MVVGQKLCRLSVRLLRHVVHLRSQAGIADRQIILGAMTWAVGTLASRLAASFVALDERAAQDRLERRQLAQECVAALPQGSGGVLPDLHRTTFQIGLIL